MSIRIGNQVVISVQPDMICFECGKVAETRPYGKGGAEICFECGEKIPEIVVHNMNIKLFGDPGELAQ